MLRAKLFSYLDQELMPGCERSISDKGDTIAVVVSFWRELPSSVRVDSCTGAVRVWWRLDDRSRMTRECHVRICGGLGGKFPGATRRRLQARRRLGRSG